ncbi:MULTISPECIES: type II toxin-antitoxin system ParD family antitoxin [unclassified Mesorhizobium]|uniref:ribbon-helix-helix domain-containing protein n=1 Tax=unclassified Mesorhizobium TaxID=325217 RepID=UPI000FDC8BAA|nr:MULTISPECIES: type II toxin-antitoxin system ParD family antitoxin [unclassified Mesorhizobium]TGQ07855.1 type II toxin-antitoxin system ParD family antitoxin [Mesorhizobium sp. M2E.F.Ca.ET.219.01.1.1]TGS09752.1 type II toxin-antitoxin system ParD family antitoxin [Mesorhizobium sp. M2E.F.Ca.ET.209.01.1.1]TGT73834.1 type II toxin-antitoxin system ParD family antitoxin [Mesorhizobium sp. M2E.F.Ca.ET.166.01.1.1]TGW00348.1 type II toxin-antitoxin system ParD family antitoxin [Mesorhizobium sp. 
MNNAEKVSVTMAREQMQAIRERVEAGEFATVSEAMRDAVRVWQRQRIEDAERLEAIRARVRRSIEDSRPSLSEDEADAALEAAIAGIDKDLDRAAS